jgi:hydroxypyruvate reductase
MIAVGKAAPSMANAACTELGGAIRAGLVIGPTDSPVADPLQLIVGDHPQPGSGSRTAALRALDIARLVPADGRLLVLLSGGASALMAVPAPGITLEEKRKATAVLLRSGADIHALNTARKHMSGIKGGQLGAAAAAPCRTFAISDVVGDDLSVIGSGPTVPDMSTFADARDVFNRFGGQEEFPPSVVHYVEAGMRGEKPETPKPGDPRLAKSRATVIGGRSDAMRGAADEARAKGYHVVVLEEPVIGEARVVGPMYVQQVLAHARTLPRPVCVISSGETTVTVKGEGRGGRNQELALAAAETLATVSDWATLASFGTDGIDGPTDAAGAIVDSTTVSRAPAPGVADIASYLQRNDSYEFFSRLGDLIVTGPTGTNVGDLQVLLLP